MKILFVSDIYSIHTARWVNSLVERDHEVTLASREPKKDLIHKVDPRVQIKYIGKSKYLTSFVSAPNLKKIYNETKPDIVNVHYASSYGFAARLSGIHPVILNVWGSDVYEFPYLKKINMKIIKGNLKYADCIASTSNIMADQVRKLLGDPNLKIPITPFGVDTEKFKPIPNKEKDDKIIIGVVKSLAHKYGIDNTIKAFGLLLKDLKLSHPEVWEKTYLYIYGEGPEKDNLKALIDSLKLNSKVLFKGVISNDKLPQAMSVFSVACLTSRMESFGVAAVESMAMGIPVVASNADGYREVIENNKTGIVVDKDNPAKIAQALKKLVLDRELREKMGIDGRIRVKTLYDWNDNVDSMLTIYEKYRIKNK